MNLPLLTRIDRLAREASTALLHLEREIERATPNDRADVARLAPRMTVERIGAACDILSRASSDIGVAVEEEEVRIEDASV